MMAAGCRRQLQKQTAVHVIHETLAGKSLQSLTGLQVPKIASILWIKASCYGHHFASLPQIFAKYMRVKLHARVCSKMVAELMIPVGM